MPIDDDDPEAGSPAPPPPLDLDPAARANFLTMVGGGAEERAAAGMVGVDPDRFQAWLDLGELGTEPYAAFLRDVIQARAKARAIASVDARKKGPAAWLAKDDRRNTGSSVAGAGATALLAQLLPKRALFVEEYVLDLNGLQAAIRAGYSPATAASQASRLLTDPKVAEAVAALQRERSEATRIDRAWLLRELMDHARVARGTAPAVKALELIGRMIGELGDQVPAPPPSPIPPEDDADLAAYLERRDREARAAGGNGGTSTGGGGNGGTPPRTTH